jgi:replicative DNA helicase
VLRTAINNISLQRYRQKIMDFGKEGPKMVLQAYHNLDSMESMGGFGWPYMDAMGGAMPGDVISFVGRPQTGKSWLSLFTGLHNWRVKKKNTLFVSMEMSHLPVAQRAATMIAGTNLTQLKHGWGHPQSYATPSYDKFTQAMIQLTQESDGAKFYVINGNLAADVEDIYLLANQLDCEIVIIDGAYLCRNKNTRLDRYTRAAENCEAMKRFSEDLQIPTFSSWQFNREASKKQKQKSGSGGTADLEDIGYSDVIGQISSVALGLFQEDSVETAIKKMIRVLKGRGGEVGQFEINWNFQSMDFSQIGSHTIATQPEALEQEYDISEQYL